MKVVDSFRRWNQIYFSSKAFWIFNLCAWLAFAVIHSVIEAMYQGAFAGHMNNITYTVLLGVVYCCVLRVIAIERRWFDYHPVKKIPLICLLAIAFSAADTIIHYLELIVLMPVTCSQDSPPPEFFQCGIVTNAFFDRLCVILVWLLLYVYIQYERKNIFPRDLVARDVVVAILALLTVKILDIALSSIAWSRQYDFLLLLYVLTHLALVIVFARAILLIKPREFFLGSRLIPLLPTIFMLVFCLGVLEIVVGNIVFRAIRFGLTGYHSDQPKTLLYVLLGGSDGIWRSAGDLSGPLHAACREICIIGLFLMYLRLLATKKLQASSDASKIDFNHSLLFWAYNVNGWFVVGACLYFSDIFGLSSVAPTIPAAFSISFFISGVFMGGMIRSILRNHYTEHSTFISLAVGLLSISCVLGIMQSCVVWFCNNIYIYLMLGETEPFRYAYFVTNTYHFLYAFVFCMISFLLWILAYEISVSQREKVNAKLKQLQLENNIKQLQLNALVGKLNPHFIFNAVNNIRYLIKKDAERSREALLVLSDMLRNPIAKTTSEKVLISEELALLRNYITLSKIQFEERLQYEEDIDPSTNRALIPPMMLQILLENAIKHGISQLPDGGVLHLTITQKKQQLMCRLVNTGELSIQSKTAGFGVGLKNISERLLLLYGQEADFSLVEVQPNVIAELTLPLEYSL